MRRDLAGSFHLPRQIDNEAEAHVLHAIYDHIVASGKKVVSVRHAVGLCP
jgi:hypothetical protein